MAFRRFRRRRSGGVWFPTSQTIGNPINVNPSRGGGDINLDIGLDASPIIDNSLDLPPFGSSAGAVTGGLVGVVGPGSAFLVKRIVGNIDVCALQGQAFDSHGHAFYGIFVDRVDNNGALQNLAAWTPNAAGNERKRWLFRRWWHLSNFSSTVLNADKIVTMTSANQMPSLNCNGFIDVKVKARVSYEERLFQVCAALPGSVPIAAGTEFRTSFYVKNLRMFAKPLMADNR